MPKLWTSIVVIAVIAAGIAFTPTGHRVLHRLGFTVACSSSDCDNG